MSRAAAPTQPRVALNVKEAAAACGVSVSTIQRAKRAGTLRAKKTADRGGRELYDPVDLRAWFESLPDA